MISPRRGGGGELPPPQAVAPAMAKAAPMAGGLHTLRTVQAEILEQLGCHRNSLEQRLDEAVRRGEDSAVHRVEASLGPPLESLQRQLATDIAGLRNVAESLFAECRGETQALRSAHDADLAQLRLELGQQREDHRRLTSQVQHHGENLATLEGARRDLWLATEAMQGSLRDVSAALQARMEAVAKKAAEETEDKWCGKLLQKIEAVEGITREVDGRSGRETSAALDTVQVQQAHFENKLESLRIDAYQEAKKQALDAATEVRKEVIEDRLISSFTQKLNDHQTSLAARVAALQQEVKDSLVAKAEETLTTADSHSAAKVAELGASIAEVVDATRHQMDAQSRTHTKAIEYWRAQLRDFKCNTDAGEALHREATKGLQERIASVQAECGSLRSGLQAARREAADGREGLRLEIKDHAARWKTFDEVGMPGVLSLIDRKSSETESRAVRAALDYTERLRRLPVAASPRYSDHAILDKAECLTTAPSSPAATLGLSGSIPEGSFWHDQVSLSARSPPIVSRPASRADNGGGSWHDSGPLSARAAADGTPISPLPPLRPMSSSRKGPSCSRQRSAGRSRVQ